MYTYPVPNRDDPKHVLGLLGSLWTHYYGGKAPLLAVVQGNLELRKQQKQNLDEAAACASRFTVPLCHIENWVPITVPFCRGLSEIAPKPPGLVSLPIMVNRLTNPTLMLQEGLDYVIKDDEIRFDYCLYSDDLVPKAGKLMQLWGFRGKFACDYVYRAFGYPIGLARAGSPAKYRDEINASTNCAVQGTTFAGIETLLAAILGEPVADGEEVVKGTATDRHGRFLYTTRHLHRISAEAVLRAPEGSQPAAGAPLLETFRVMELHQAPNDITTVKILAGMTDDASAITVSRDDLEISSCVLIPIDPDLVTVVLLLLIERVLPPQTGLAFATP